MLRAGGAATLAMAGGSVGGVISRARLTPRISGFDVKPRGRVQTFHSRPDLRPPAVTVSLAANPEARAETDPGLMFLGPGPVSLKGAEQYGPLIVDRDGGLVWFRPLGPGLEVTNFGRSRYRGEPVLVWWEGKILPSGYGQGEAVILDRHYREVTRVRAASGRAMDLHALTVTPEGTALFTCYPEAVRADLSAIGGRRDGQAFESVIQEVDIASGRLLFEWRSLEHIPMSASYQPHGDPYDYLHVNSIQRLPDGNLLISGRHTWAVYKLERRTGEVMWTLGGKRSQFHMGRGAQFAWQHDANQLSGAVLTLFDNETDGPIETERQSRGMVLEVDDSRRRVTLRTAYTSPHRLLAGAMGSLQTLPSGRVMVGWGVASYTTEFDAGGTRLLDFALRGGMYSYRALWLPWHGTPNDHPDVAVVPGHQRDTATLYVSWNGASEITGWRVDAGPGHRQLRPVGVAASQGFETRIAMQTRHRYAAVTPLDGAGRGLKQSRVVKL